MIDRTVQAAEVPSAPCRILLVSDHRGASEALGAHLAHHGFTLVAHESSAQSAEVAARRERPDVVLIDAAVHGGWERIVSALDSVPPGRIAVLAAYWGVASRQAAAATGIGAVLLKRVQGRELVTRLRELGARPPAERPGHD